MPLCEPLRSDFVSAADGSFARLPENLGEAIDAAKNSDFVRSVITDDILELFVNAKREEWETYCVAADKARAEEAMYLGVY